MKTRSIILAILVVSVLCCIGHAATPADSQLARLLAGTTSDPAKRAEELKRFAKSNPGTGAASDAQLFAGLALLKTEVTGAEKEALSLFKEIMKQGRGTWREAVATVSMVNALHVSGQHESVRELAVYSLENRTLDKLESAENDITEAVKAELKFDPLFYRNLMLVMLALAHENLKEPDEAGRVFARITHPSILASYPNGIGTPPPQQTKPPMPTETSPKSKGPDPTIIRTPPQAGPTPAVHPLSPEKASEAKPTSTPSERPASTTPWSIIVVLIVAATGLLWLLLKNRK